MRRSQRLSGLRARNDLKIVSISRLLNLLLKLFLFILRINIVDGISSITLTISHLYRKNRINGHLITSNHMLSLDQDTINPVFLTRYILRSTQLEAHGSQLSHSLSQRTVVNHIRDGQGRCVIRVDRHINHSSSLYPFSRNRRLFQDTVRRKIAYISRIRHFNLKSGIIKDTLSVSETLISNIRNQNSLTMMSIEFNTELNAHTKQCDNHSHSEEIAPEILALKLIKKFR